MNRLIWRLLRQHISVGQLAGFFLANLFGMTIVLLSIQFYRDISPVFTQGDSFMKKEYIITSKKVSTLGSLAGKSSVFSADEIEELRKQPFTKNVGEFTATQFSVSAGVNMEGTGIRIATEMFFEAVPDQYVDVKLDKWRFDESTNTIPIIIPRNYLNLYNFGFAQSRNLPQLSEGVVGLVNMDVVLRGNEQVKRFKGSIAGFSNRLNTILVPQSFMDWANRTFAPFVKPEPTRLIVEVNNPADAAIAKYYREKGYEAEEDKLDAGKTTHFLNLLVGIVLSVGLLISILSFYILMLSVFLLLQKNTTKLENLLLTGHSPGQVAFPYQALTIGLNLAVLALAVTLVSLLRSYYLGAVTLLFPQLQTGSLMVTIVTGAILFFIVSLVNVLVVKRKVEKLFFN